MKLKEAYENYSYNNIGQFRALSETLGYKTEYHDGSYLFHKGDDSIQLSLDEIRSKAKENRNEQRAEESKEKVCSFFDNAIQARSYTNMHTTPATCWTVKEQNWKRV